MNNKDKSNEGLAKQLHEWYLEATKALNPESYNPNAQKSYEELTEEQKDIDRFIAAKIDTICDQRVREAEDNGIIRVLKRAKPLMDDRMYGELCAPYQSILPNKITTKL